MNIDITKLITQKQHQIDIDEDLDFDLSNYKTPIRKLKDIHLNCKLTLLADDTVELNGNLKGIMILGDDLTLEDVDYVFNIDISENIERETQDNIIDVSQVMLQNILTEVPTTVNGGHRNIKKEGKNWRFLTEEELSKETKESPFSHLQEIIDKKNKNSETVDKE